MASDPVYLPENRPGGLMFKHIVRKIFFEDWAMKAVALAITLGLWFGVTGLSTPTTQRMTGIPLTLRYSNDTEITNSPIQEIDLVISGDKRKISQINKNDLAVSVDISDVMPGDRVIQLAPENITIELPTGVKLEEIQPNRIAVRIESVLERDIPVKAETEGEPAEGFEVYGQTAAPPNVRVRGPAGFIRSLNFVSTEKIDLSGRQADFTARQIPISISNPKSTVLETVVDVTFRIGEKRVEKRFAVPVKNDAFTKAAVILFGPKSLLESLSAQEMSVEADEEAGNDSSPRLVLPPQAEGRIEVRSIKLN